MGNLNSNRNDDVQNNILDIFEQYKKLSEPFWEKILLLEKCIDREVLFNRFVEIKGLNLQFGPLLKRINNALNNHIAKQFKESSNGNF
jgi:hypothetical protein